MIKEGLIFVAGAVAGVAGTYFYMRNKVDKEINEGIEAAVSEKEAYYNNKLAAMDKEETKEARVLAKAAVQKPSLEECEKILHKNNYISQSAPSENASKEKIYVIDIDQYDDNTNYSKETVTYYDEDGTLTDVEDEIILIEDTIGQECLDVLANSEDDVVYVRNTEMCIDYEVNVIHNSFAKIMGMEEED